MENKIYKYVYRMILFEIYNGSFRLNNKLPSNAQLCAKYNVGRNSVSKALSELEKNGYIKIVNGTTATVIFSSDLFKTNIKYRQALVDNRKMVSDIFETMRLILPDIVVAAIRNASDEQMSDWLQEIESFDFASLAHEPKKIKELYNLYLYASHFLDNPVFTDLFNTLLSSIYSPSLDSTVSDESFVKALSFIKTQLKLIYKCGKLKQCKLIKKIIASLCSNLASSMEGYMDKIGEGLSPINETSFIWTKDRNQQRLYLKVSATILLEIGAGEYKDGEKLLSIAKKSEKYGVSEKTIRKSLQFLNEIKAIKTINGIGSVVDLSKVNNLSNIDNQQILDGLRDLYYGLEIYNMFIPNLLYPLLKNASKEEISALLSNVGKRSILVDTLQGWVNDHFNPCMSSICNHLMEYRFLTVFIDTKKIGFEAELGEYLNKLYYYLNNKKYKEVCHCVDHLQKLYLSVLRELCFEDNK